MRASSFIALGTRHAVGVGLQALLIAAIVGLAALALSGVYKPAAFLAGVDTVEAAKGGKPVAAASGSSISLDGGSSLVLGGSLTFTTQVVGLKGGEYPMVVVSCSDGAGVIYAQLDHPGATFVLGGGSSDWRTQGGPADCSASLYAYGGRSQGDDTIRRLGDPVGFHAGG